MPWGFQFRLKCKIVEVCLIFFFFFFYDDKQSDVCHWISSCFLFYYTWDIKQFIAHYRHVKVITDSVQSGCFYVFFTWWNQSLCYANKFFLSWQLWLLFFTHCGKLILLQDKFCSVIVKICYLAFCSWAAECDRFIHQSLCFVMRKCVCRESSGVRIH